ncbi:MAG TPA: phosphatase PAP2-related protein [Mucilaginibacter sp.]
MHDIPTSSIKETWKEAWKSSRNRQQIIIGTVSMLIVVFILPVFFGYIEKRKGILLNDWVLDQLPPHNVSGLIFVIIWGMILFVVIRAIFNPRIYITYAWALVFVCIARLICITLVPLDPPTGLIPLTDPLTGVFYGNTFVTKDLFFSGHTAILTLIALCLEKKTDKLIAWLAVIAVGFLLLVQHVHYTIDVLAAPVIAYVLYTINQHFLFKSKSVRQNKRQEEAVSKPQEKAVDKPQEEAADKLREKVLSKVYSSSK